MKVEVKWVDHNDDLPLNPDDPCMLCMTAGIGEVGSEGADNFDVIVCNSAWIAAQVQKTEPFWARGHLIVHTIQVESVKRALQLLIDRTSTEGGWDKFAERLNRWLFWEFEDYREHSPDQIARSAQGRKPL
jgi:hypothetical protein